MQQNQPGRRFNDPATQQPVYRFPQNQSANGWQPQPGFSTPVQEQEDAPLSRKDRRKLKRLHRRKRRKIFTWWNLFAVIGIITTFVQAMRYVIIPALVYLNVLAGGGQ